MADKVDGQLRRMGNRCQQQNLENKVDRRMRRIGLKKGQQQIPAYKPMVKPQTNQDWQQIAAGKVDHGLLPTSTSTDQPTLPVADHS